MFVLCGLTFRLVVGSLHVGDEILEINGTNVTNHSVDQLQKAMVGIVCHCLCEVWIHTDVCAHEFSIKSLYCSRGLLPLLVPILCKK